MSALLDEETTTVVLDELDFEIPCIVGSDEGHAAEVVVECRFCPVSAFHCWEHWANKRRKVDDFLAQFILNTVICKDCGTKAASLDELVKVVPL